MSGSEEHEAKKTGAARSIDMLGRLNRNHNIDFAENSFAHRALLRIGTRNAGEADIRTAAVALLTGRNLGFLVALAALKPVQTKSNCVKSL